MKLLPKNCPTCKSKIHTWTHKCEQEMGKVIYIWAWKALKRGEKTG